MHNRISKQISIFLFLLFISQCSGDQSYMIPEYILDIENVTVFPKNAQPKYKIHLNREMTFWDMENMQIGRLGTFAIDDSNRIYISDVDMRTVHLYEPDGQIVKMVGGEGSGPGEYRFGPYTYIISNQLHAYEGMIMRMDVYSEDSMDLIQTLNLNPINQSQYSELSDSHVRQIFPIMNGKYLVCFAQFMRVPPTRPGQNMDGYYFRYYLIEILDNDEHNAKIISDMVIELEQSRFLTGIVDGQAHMASEHFQVFSRPLVTISGNGYIFSAKSEQFLIEKRGPDGEYIGAIYYPFNHLALTRKDALDAQITGFLKEIISQNELPDTWPALENILADDENRLWVSTIVEDFDIYELWVLKDTGELLTRFEWPRNEPIEVVKNGFMYTRETDEETGLQLIVKYRFELI